MRELRITSSIVERDSIILQKYFNDISKIPLISPEEEFILSEKILRHGDKNALDKLVETNLRFAASVAKKYQGRGLPLMDLISEGNLGLIKAAQRFDATKGFKFISYAVWWIRQNIHLALLEQGRVVRLPLRVSLFYTKAKKAASQFEQYNERLPSTEELAELLEMSEEEIVALVTSEQYHTSLDAPIPGNEDMTFGDLIKSYEAVDYVLINESLETEVTRSIDSLKLNQKIVINAFFGLQGEEPMQLEDIGKKYNLTYERIRQIKEKGISSLQSTHSGMRLKEFLG